MRKALSVLTIVTVLLHAVLLMAHDKVVVIPLNKNIGLDKSCMDASATKNSEGIWTFVCDTKRVFVSSTYSNGNLGGLAGADAQCNALASGAGLKGTFKAWLSDSHTSVISRFNMNPYSVYRLTDGSIIATSPDDLLDGTLNFHIQKDKNSIHMISYYAVWTGSMSDGSRENTSFKCGDWLEVDGSLSGGIGNMSVYGPQWSRQTFDYGCDELARIYCFEQ